MDEEVAIQQTEAWIKSVVIGLNFCPFAARSVATAAVDYKVKVGATQKEAIDILIKALKELDTNQTIETTLIIFPKSFVHFSTYLTLVKAAQRTLEKKGYEGVYQLATFHPDYLFGDAPADDPANYTNRSPYPILQVLREKSVSRAVAAYPDVEGIPDRNINHAREKGRAQMQALLAACLLSGTDKIH